MRYCISRSFLLEAEQDSTELMYHSLFIHSLRMDTVFGYHQVVTNICVQVCVWTYAFLSLT